MPPSPLPPERERGAEGGAREIQPRADALAYSMSPLTGLPKTGGHENDYLNELLTQDTSADPLFRSAAFRGMPRGAAKPNQKTQTGIA